MDSLKKNFSEKIVNPHTTSWKDAAILGAVLGVPTVYGIRVALGKKTEPWRLAAAALLGGSMGAGANILNRKYFPEKFEMNKAANVMEKLAIKFNTVIEAAGNRIGKYDMASGELYKERYLKLPFRNMKLNEREHAELLNHINLVQESAPNPSKLKSNKERRSYINSAAMLSS